MHKLSAGLRRMVMAITIQRICNKMVFLSVGPLILLQPIGIRLKVTRARTSEMLSRTSQKMQLARTKSESSQPVKWKSRSACRMWAFSIRLMTKGWLKWKIWEKSSQTRKFHRFHSTNLTAVAIQSDALCTRNFWQSISFAWSSIPRCINVG